MNKMEVIWLSPLVGGFAACISSILALVLFWVNRLVGERGSRKAMTLAAIGGAIAGVLSVVIGEGTFLTTLWRKTFGEWVTLSGTTELLGLAFTAGWLAGGLLALVVAVGEMLRGGSRHTE